MPEQPDEAELGDAESGKETPGEGEAAAGAEPADAEAEAVRRARVEAAKRRYRATLRNEADRGEGGFSKDFYRSQKPPHWG